MYHANDLESYLRELPCIIKKLTSFDPHTTPLVEREVNPYSVNIIVGLPLFRTHGSQKNYESFSYSLRHILKNQFHYDNYRTHISIAAPIRGGQKRNEGHHYESSGDKGIFYKEYLKVFDSITFDSFSLRVKGVYPPGIMLFQPEENADQFFKLRRQIAQGLVEAKKITPSLYYETDAVGSPQLDTGIIHSTFLRFSDREELFKKKIDYLKLLYDINKKIETNEIFSEHLIIEDISFIETCFSYPISQTEWHTNEIIRRKSVHG